MNTNDNKILSHTTWNCKYHIVFAQKYRRKIFYEQNRLEIREILRKLCQWKGVEILEGEICPDHVHMLVTIPPKILRGVRAMRSAKEHFGIYGIFERKEQPINIPKVGSCKIQYRCREF